MASKLLGKKPFVRIKKIDGLWRFDVVQHRGLLGITEPKIGEILAARQWCRERNTNDVIGSDYPYWRDVTGGLIEESMQFKDGQLIGVLRLNKNGSEANVPVHVPDYIKDQIELYLKHVHPNVNIKSE